MQTCKAPCLLGGRRAVVPASSGRWHGRVQVSKCAFLPRCPLGRHAHALLARPCGDGTKLVCHSFMDSRQPYETGNAGYELAHLAISLGLLFALDKGLGSAFASNGIAFPAPLAGALAIPALLLFVGEATAARAVSFFKPALVFLSAWMPLFFVGPLLVLPLTLDAMPAAEIMKAASVVAVGAAATCMFTGYAAATLRSMVKTQVVPAAPDTPAAPYRLFDFFSLAAIAAVALAGTYLKPWAWGPKLMLPFQVAATVLALHLGSMLPQPLRGLLHPLVACCIMTNALTYLQGHLMGRGWAESTRSYFTQGWGNPGGGDILMSFLGVVILSFGFRIYMQRDTLKRHAPVLVSTAVLSALFSLFSTAYLARWLELSSEIGRALLPRSVPVALAIPIADGLSASLPLAAAAILLQSFLGARFAAGLMDKAQINDSVARGAAAGATGGQLGAAALAARQPDTLTFASLSYSLAGVSSMLLLLVPQVRDMLLRVVG